MTRKGEKKPRIYPRLCYVCRKKFLAADVKAEVCYKCRLPVPCKCGCGEMARSAAFPHRPGHASRIDTVVMRIGHKHQSKKIRGKNNPSHKSRKKLSKALKTYWSKLKGKARRRRLQRSGFYKNPHTNRYRMKDGYRSVLEKRVAEGLKRRGLAFRYEKCKRFTTGRRFYPDFELEDGTLVEVSGYAYKSWQDAFDEKVEKIVAAGFKLICITYGDKATLLRSRVGVPVYTIKEFFRDYIDN